MSVTTYRSNKVITAVVKTTEFNWPFGMPQEEEVIVVTWTEKKSKRRKVRPMMGDDYYVEEPHEIKTEQRFKFTQEKFDELTAKIGQPTLVRHVEDPFAPPKSSKKD